MIHEPRDQPISGVYQLDEYIKAHERRFGGMRVPSINLASQAMLLESLKQLKEALRREKRHRVEAEEHLRDTNKTMKKTIADLQESFKSCRASIRNEFEKIESANTDRLLNINPNSLYKRMQRLG